MTGLIITALTVFFAWEALLRTVLFSVTDALPEPLCNLVRYAAIAAACWAVDHYRYTAWYLPMAAAALVAILHGAAASLKARSEERAALAMRRGRPPGIR